MTAATGRLAGRSTAGRLAASRLAAAAMVTVLAVAAVTLLAARLAAGLAAGGSGAAGRLTDRSGTAGRFATGRLAAARAAAATAIIAVEEAGLSVVRETRDGASHEQHGKQDLRFHGSPQKTGTGCSFSRRSPDSLQTHVRPILLAAIVKPCWWR